MKLIGLDEHFVTPDILSAWKALDPKYQDVALTHSDGGEIGRRLIDVGDERIGAMADMMVPRFRGHGFRPFVVRPVPGFCIRERSGSFAGYSSPRYTRTDRVWHPRGSPIAAGGRVRP